MKALNAIIVTLISLSLLAGCSDSEDETTAKTIACTNSDYVYELMNEKDYLEMDEYSVVLNVYIDSGKCTFLSTEEGSYHVVDTADDMSTVEAEGRILYARTIELNPKASEAVATSNAVDAGPQFPSQVKLNKFHKGLNIFICSDEQALLRYMGSVDYKQVAKQFVHSGQCQVIQKKDVSKYDVYIDGTGLKHSRIHFWDPANSTLDSTPYFVNSMAIFTKTHTVAKLQPGK